MPSRMNGFVTLAMGDAPVVEFPIVPSALRDPVSGLIDAHAERLERVANPTLQRRPGLGRRGRGFLELLARGRELLVQLTERRVDVGRRDLLVNLSLKREDRYPARGGSGWS